MRRGRVVEPEHVPSPFTVHFPGVMPSGPRSLVVLCSAVIARRITKDIRLPDALPVDARVAILEEMRYCCTLSDDTFPILITFANGSPCLPRSLKLRSCEFVSDRTLRYISELNTRDSHKNLREIDVRGCTKVTYDAIHELFSAQTSKTADFGGKGSKVPLAKPLVRVRTYPLPVLAAYQADRIIHALPANTPIATVIETLTTDLGPEVYLGQARPHTFSVMSSISAIDNRFGYTNEEWEKHAEEDIDNYDKLLCPPPNATPPTVTLLQQLDLPMDFAANIQLSADLPTGGYYVAVSRMFEPLIVILRRRGSEFVELCSLPPSPLFKENPWDLQHANENPPHVKERLHWHITYRNVHLPHHAVLLRWHPSRPMLVVARRMERIRRKKGVISFDGNYTLELWSFEQAAPKCLWCHELNHRDGRPHSDVWLNRATVTDDAIWISVLSRNNDLHSSIRRYELGTGLCSSVKTYGNYRRAHVLKVARYKSTGKAASEPVPGGFFCVVSYEELQLLQLNEKEIAPVRAVPMPAKSNLYFDVEICSMSPVARTTGVGSIVVVTCEMGEWMSLRLHVFRMPELTRAGVFKINQRLAADTTLVYRRIMYSNLVNSYNITSSSLVWTSENSILLPGHDGELLNISWQTQPPTNPSIDCAVFTWSRLPVHCWDCSAVAAKGDTIISGGFDATIRVWKR